MKIYLPLTHSPRYPLVKPLFLMDELYQMEVLDEDASNLAQFEHLDYCATGVEVPDEDEEPSYEQLQQIYHNTQASLVLLSSLKKEEFDRVNGLEKAKFIWVTLQRAHEGTKPIKKARRQLIEGQLNRFIMLYDEDPREMYN
jgi:gluconate kinase